MSNGTVVGDVCEVFRNESCVKFDWIIHSQSIAILSKKGFWYISNTIDVLDIEWYLGLRRTNAGKKEVIQLAMFRKSKHCPRKVRFTLDVRQNDGTEKTVSRDESFPDGADFRTSDKPLSFQMLFGVPYFRRTTIICTLRIEKPTSVERETHVTRATQTEAVSPNASSEDDAHLNGEGEVQLSRQTQTEDFPPKAFAEEDGVRLDTEVDDFTLRKHLKDLLLTGDDHDVILKVKQKEFRAHKNMLRARSPVFAAMFKHKMKENTDGSISIEDCDPDAFGEFLNYVYTGRVEDLSPSKAMGLYYAADRYDFSGLKKICVEYLTDST